MKLKLIATLFTSIALLAPIGVQAFPFSTCTTNICDISIAGGSYKVFEVTTTPGLLVPVTSDLANVKDILINNMQGNVQLGTPSAPGVLTTMEVTFNGGAVATLSNLLLADWTNNSNALVHSYITAAGNSVGITLTAPQLLAATNYFLTHQVAPGINVWQLVSDPSIATINLVNGQIIVGQDGILHPYNYLNTLFAGSGAIAPPNAQASEAVKVTINGNSQYVYSFSATPTGYATADGSYNGRYQVPEPATLLMLGLGFIGLAYRHRHNKRDQVIMA